MLYQLKKALQNQSLKISFKQIKANFKKRFKGETNNPTPDLKLK
jgi:hypothetical protein